MTIAGRTIPATLELRGLRAEIKLSEEAIVKQGESLEVALS